MSVFAAGQLPGIDTDRGLRQMAGNEKMYLTLLRSFYEHHANDRTLINVALAAGQDEEVLRMVHTLKGLVASFGAIELGAVTMELEQRLRGSDEQALQQSLAQFGELYEQLIDGLRIFLAKREEEMPPCRGEKSLDSAKLIALLRQFVITQYSDLGAAESQLDAILAELAGSQLNDEAERLLRHFENYDLEQAEAAAQQLIARLS